MTEWKKIEGHEGYEISVEGVRSYWERGSKNKLEIPVMLKFSINNYGYYRFNLGGKTRYFHRLLMIAFVPNPENKPFIDHINRIRTDNRIENLRWATMEENMSNQNLSIRNKLGVQYISKSGSGFEFRITRNGILHRKYFKTLEEAEAYRNQYLMM